MATMQNTRNGNTGVGVSVRLGWPQERWIGAIILAALGLLIIIRLGFRGVGVQLGATGRIST